MEHWTFYRVNEIIEQSGTIQLHLSQRLNFMIDEIKYYEIHPNGKISSFRFQSIWDY